MKRFAVIVAGGSGSRIGGNVPKQFLSLHNKPIIVHTIHRFLAFDANMRVIVALPEFHLETWNTISKKHNLSEDIAVVFGGEKRFDTVRNALEFVPDEALVAIHDAVRPAVSMQTIAQSFAAAEQSGSGIPYILPASSIRYEKESGEIVSLNRDKTRIIQTPQTFDAARLKSAYQLPYQEHFTDDATVWENAGNALSFFEGNPENIKITFPFDLKIAEYLLSHE